MSDIYCGTKKIPKGKRIGSMKECVEAGKVSYYGIQKIDSRLIKAIGLGKTKAKSIAKMESKEMILRNKANNIKKKFAELKKKGKKDDKEKMEKMKKEYTEIVKEHEKIKDDIALHKSSKKYIIDEPKKKAKTGSKKGSKTGSKTGSKKGSTTTKKK